MKKIFLKTKEDWIKLKEKYKFNPKIKRHHQTILDITQKNPKKFPCVALQFTRTYMTDANENYYGFVYLADFQEN